MPSRRTFLGVMASLPLIGALVRRAAVDARPVLGGYAPLPKVRPWHESKALIKVLRGGCRSGKTWAAANEVARRALASPIRVCIIGYDNTHLGQTIHRVLFEGDAPLIPQAAIIPESVAWEDKAKKVLRHVALHNGTSLVFRSSLQEPGHGNPFDVVWIDESMDRPSHLWGYVMRLAPDHGQLLLSQYPHAGEWGGTLQALHAMAAATDVAPVVHETVISTTDNPYYPQDELKRQMALFTPAECCRRIYGEFV